MADIVDFTLEQVAAELQNQGCINFVNARINQQFSGVFNLAGLEQPISYTVLLEELSLAGII